MTVTTTRRAILASASVLPLMALPALAVPRPTEPDPIFAAIEAHRGAFQDYLRILTNVPEDHDLIMEGSEYEASSTREVDAAIELVNIQPETIGGIIALLDYVRAFNRGEITCARKSVFSENVLWPTSIVSDDFKSRRGEPLEMPFEFWVMENVRQALLEIADTARDKII